MGMRVGTYKLVVISMGKPISHLFESLLFLVLVVITAAYTVLALKQNNYPICYVNAGSALIALIMATVNLVLFFRALSLKREGRRFKDNKKCR